MSDSVEVSRETAESAARLLARFHDDEAILRGVAAVRRMLVLRQGGHRDHADAFRRAFLETPKAAEE